MCGIHGFTFSDERRIRSMIDAASHRGPDGMGFHVGDGISLGHNRLSMTDSSPYAIQPLWSADRRHVIILNGEIYNHKELRSELAGYPFKSESDTEVVLAAYERWGSRCVDRFDGMFAFAIWSSARAELFLARDSHGVKPLYYMIEGGEIVFSSEIKALLAHGGRYPLSRPAFSLYMRCGYVPGPLTMFSGIFKFPPGHCGIFSHHALRIEKYAAAPVPSAPYHDYRAAQDAARSAIQSSVSRHLATERPLGMYLSGGLDSGIILDCASRVSHRPLMTFCASYSLSADESPAKFNADAVLARRTAAAYGTRHHETVIAAEDVIPLLDQAAIHLDEPIANPTVISMMKIAHEASRDVRAILSGDGGDELFGGYPRYLMSRRMNLLRSLPRCMQPRAIRETALPLDRFGLFMWEKDARLLPVLGAGVRMDGHRSFFGALWDNAPAEDFESSFMDIDRRTWLIDESLMSVDKMTMSAGVEARVPFLSSEVISVSLRMPTRYKIGLFSTKRVLRDAFRGRLPDYLLSQPKRGWMSPGAKWLRRPLIHAYAKSLFSSSYSSSTDDLFNWAGVTDLLDRHVFRHEYHLPILWKVLAFQAWAGAFRGSIR